MVLARVGIGVSVFEHLAVVVVVVVAVAVVVVVVVVALVAVAVAVAVAVVVRPILSSAKTPSVNVLNFLFHQICCGKKAAVFARQKFFHVGLMFANVGYYKVVH
jgi:hypothetical protein